MAISRQMQARFETIESLVENGYSLQKMWGYYPNLVKPSGESVNIFGGFFSFSGPAGFSWIAFFFPWAVCAQIREWSFFYFLGIFDLFSTILNLSFNTSSNISWVLIGYFYANMFPYLRYMASNKGITELPKAASIFLGFTLCIVAAMPALLLSLVAF